MYCASMLSKDLVAASSKPLVLSILAGGESYGYEIMFTYGTGGPRGTLPVL